MKVVSQLSLLLGAVFGALFGLMLISNLIVTLSATGAKWSSQLVSYALYAAVTFALLGWFSKPKS
jgi:hypothetical protein